jgi:hypothetical protein
MRAGDKPNKYMNQLQKAAAWHAQAARALYVGVKHH